MNSALLRDTVALGAITGIRSMAGPATLTFGHGVVPTRVAALLAVAEMVIDKTPWIGARTEAVPLAGRAVLGAVVGAVVAHERGGDRLFGAAIGAAASVAAAYLATMTRRRLASANVAGGLLEDALVVGVGAAYAASRREHA